MRSEMVIACCIPPAPPPSLIPNDYESEDHNLGIVLQMANSNIWNRFKLQPNVLLASLDEKISLK